MPSQTGATGGKKPAPLSKQLTSGQKTATGRTTPVKPQEIYVKPRVSTAATVDAGLAVITTHEDSTDPHSEYITESEGTTLYGTDIDDLKNKYDELILDQDEHNIQEMLFRERHSSGIRGYEIR